jgi:hypothetical protein
MAKSPATVNPGEERKLIGDSSQEKLKELSDRINRISRIFPALQTRAENVLQFSVVAMSYPL